MLSQYSIKKIVISVGNFDGENLNTLFAEGFSWSEKFHLMVILFGMEKVGFLEMNTIQAQKLLKRQQPMFFIWRTRIVGNVGWEPVAEKSSEGGKGKLIAMSIVGMLVLSALGWYLRIRNRPKVVP